jgi:hypothetical protein
MVSGSAAWAQSDAAAPAAPAATPAAAPAVADAGTACELHIWPAERFTAQTTGWLSGFGMLGALADSSAHADKDKGNRTEMASALDSPGQLAALQSLDLISLMKVPGAKIITHDKPLERHTMNKITTRRAESNSPCYSELIVGDIFYQKAAIYGRSLRALFMYRNFGSGNKIVREYKAWGGNGLKLFPPKPGEDVQAANDELVHVFQTDFNEFARSMAASGAGGAK